MSELTEWVLAAGTVVGGLGTAGGLVYAARQIQAAREEQRTSERWKRTEFARALIDRLSTDEELAFCTRALDWGVGPLIIPARYRPLFPVGTATFEHNVVLMAAALKADLDVVWRQPEALTYRYCFDSFFAYLDAIRYHVAVGNVDLSQLVGLQYYLDLVRVPRYSAKEEDNTFGPFLDRYFPGLKKFIWTTLPAEGKGRRGQCTGSAA
ncbi:MULTISPECIES: hypothetical protein [unclassified Bradyrhizobium]|uniref:hypothetical protein n=1 Tax=unclassified Bradyrhizobium TaxID=2631580 RepID=UPI001FF77480|nr:MULTISPECIES: hypothetical protein [unclassified Bradyrhizobium]MCK1310754.1 hypothetical protein [Bradyrhizobium sp. 45]MCK1698170.1 hypothetical protein [Bradyrhizobium sp. 144]